MEGLVEQLMSPQNNARQAAEDSFQKMKDSVPELCVVGLVRVLRQSSKADSRTFCAVLLRKVGRPHGVILCVHATTAAQVALHAGTDDAVPIGACRLAHTPPHG